MVSLWFCLTSIGNPRLRASGERLHQNLFENSSAYVALQFLDNSGERIRRKRTVNSCRIFLGKEEVSEERFAGFLSTEGVLSQNNFCTIIFYSKRPLTSSFEYSTPASDMTPCCHSLETIHPKCCSNGSSQQFRLWTAWCSARSEIATPCEAELLIWSEMFSRCARLVATYHSIRQQRVSRTPGQDCFNRKEHR